MVLSLCWLTFQYAQRNFDFCCQIHCTVPESLSSSNCWSEQKSETYGPCIKVGQKGAQGALHPENQGVPGLCFPLILKYLVSMLLLF